MILDRNRARRCTRKFLVIHSETRVRKTRTLLALVGFHREFLPQVGFPPCAGISFSRRREKCFELATIETFSGDQSIGWAQRRRLSGKTRGNHRRRTEKRRPVGVFVGGRRRGFDIKGREGLEGRIIRGRERDGN